MGQIAAAGGFPVVYADPPWSYRNRGRGAAANHYETQSTGWLGSLRVRDLAAPDSVLFLWATWPCLPEALGVMGAWGFDYKTCAFVWLKHRERSGKRHVGGGFWTRANTEFCLLGVRGRGHPRRVDRSVRQLVETDEPGELLCAPLSGHSAKPPEAREKIVQLMGDLPRAELFAREKAPGWSAWGDEIDSDFDMEEREWETKAGP